MISTSTVLSFDEVRPFVGEAFTLDGRGLAEIPVKLSEARSLGFNTPAERGGRESFALLFHAPASARVPQGTYEFSHPRFGTHGLFLVPLGPDAQGMRLEVIFNFS